MNQYDLLKYARKDTSQHGEDGIIEQIFKIMPPVNKWCVEVGAFTGFSLSNTYTLINSHGWKSVQIEGDRRPYRRLAHRYKGNPSVYCMNKMIWFEGSDLLDNLLGQTPIPVDFDFLVIDIDSYDYHIWDTLVKYRPRIVMIEFNETIPNDISFIQRKDSPAKQGTSLLATTELGKRKGYELICVIEGNAIYVVKECFDLFGFEDNSLDYLHKSPYKTNIFELYDGTLVISGYGKYVWNRIKRREFSLLDRRRNEVINRDSRHGQP